MYDGFFLLGCETRPELLTRSCDQKNQEEVQYKKNGVDGDLRDKHDRLEKSGLLKSGWVP